MGQSLSRTAPRGLPTIWRPTPPSHGLSTALREAESSEETGFPPSRPFLPAVISEAEIAALEYKGACQAAGAALILRWLFDLNAAVSAPLEPDAFRVRAGAVADVCADVPVCLFTAETRIEAAKTLRFFPGAADLTALLAPRLAAIHRTQRALARIVASPRSDAPPARSATAEERDRIVSNFRLQIAATRPPARSPSEQIDQSAPEPSRAYRPAHLSQGALIEHYRAIASDPRGSRMGRHAAQSRLDALLRQVAEMPVSLSQDTPPSPGDSADER